MNENIKLKFLVCTIEVDSEMVKPALECILHLVQQAFEQKPDQKTTNSKSKSFATTRR